ncbi:DUF1904 family protein [Paenibacillus tarimensis]
MPQLTVRGIPLETMMEMSHPLINELAEVCACGKDNFTVDCLQTTSVYGGLTADTFPFVEVAWFDRGREVRDRFAEVIARRLMEGGIAELEIAFKVYKEDEYYINGRSCSEME